MNKKLVSLYILPLLRTLIDDYLSRLSGTEFYAKHAEPLYGFYEWVYQEVNKE